MPTRRHRTIGLTVVMGAIALLSACGSDGGRGSSTPTTLPVTSPTTSSVTSPTTSSVTSPTTGEPTSAPVTTTATVVPPDLQSSPEAASGALIQDWESGDRASAAKVATARAVDVLFAEPYGHEVLNDRGCGTAGPNPVVCTWGPFALASPTNPIYNITTRPSGADWYASTVVKLG